MFPEKNEFDGKTYRTNSYSGLKHTEKYTRAVDKLKEEAINSLPELKFSIVKTYLCNYEL